MEKEINIISISEEHFDGLLNLFKEFAEFQQSSDKMLNTIDRMKEDREYINGLVAVNRNNDIIGYVTFFFAYYTWSGKSLYMDDLYIQPAYRGSGLGTTLIKKVILLAEISKCAKLRWQVSKWNISAIGFYKKLGAVVDDVEMNCDFKV